MKIRTCLRPKIGVGYQKQFVREFLDHGIDTKGRIIYLGNVTYSEGGIEIGINSALAERVIGGLIQLNRSNSLPIRMLMNTPGGEISDGYAIYDAIRSSRSPVDLEVFGQTCSMGAIILQAGRSRALHPNTLFMIHEGKFNMADLTPRQHVSWARWCEEDNERMYRIFSQRSGKTGKFWEKLCVEKHDVIFNAKRALELGLADSIIEPADWALKYSKSK